MPINNYTDEKEIAIETEVATAFGLSPMQAVQSCRLSPRLVLDGRGLSIECESYNSIIIRPLQMRLKFPVRDSSKLYAGTSSIIIIHYYELIINVLRHQ